MEHFAEALLRGKADAVLAASLFHYHEVDIGALKTYLAARGNPDSSSGEIEEEQHGSKIRICHRRRGVGPREGDHRRVARPPAQMPGD